MRILYATDGSENSLAGARFLAALTLAPTDVIAVLSITNEADPHAAAEVVDQVATALPHGPKQIETILRSGQPAEEIVNAAAELPADLLVLGARGHSGLAALLLGSVSDQVLRQASCPVLLARPLAGALTRVLLGTDGSPGASRAADYLQSFPLPVESEIRVLTLIPGFDQLARGHVALAPPLVPSPTTLAELRQREALQQLESAATPLRNSGKRVVTEIRGLDPAEGLLTVAREESADLVVIGTHTHTRMERFFLGSVSEHVAHHAPCSVLLVR